MAGEWNIEDDGEQFGYFDGLDYPSIQENRARRARSTRKMNRIFGAALLGIGVLTVAGFAMNEHAQSSERHSLSQQASEKVLHFARLANGQGEESDMDSSNTVFSAKVELTTGGTCDIEYTAASKGWMAVGDMFPNEAHLVDLGTCEPA